MFTLRSPYAFAAFSTARLLGVYVPEEVLSYVAPRFEQGATSARRQPFNMEAWKSDQGEAISDEKKVIT